MLHFTTLPNLSKGPQLNCCRVNSTKGTWTDPSFPLVCSWSTASLLSLVFFLFFQRLISFGNLTLYKYNYYYYLLLVSGQAWYFSYFGLILFCFVFFVFFYLMFKMKIKKTKVQLFYFQAKDQLLVIYRLVHNDVGHWYVQWNTCIRNGTRGLLQVKITLCCTSKQFVCLDDLWNCQRPVFSLSVSQRMHKISKL